MARRKNAKSKRKRLSFGPAGSKKKKKKSAAFSSLLKVLSATVLVGVAVICLFATAGMGVALLEKYVNNNVPVSERVGALELIGVPAWVSRELEEKVYAAATAGGEDLRLDRDAARSVHDNLKARVCWLDGIKVRTTYDSIRVEAVWRRPVALIKMGLSKRYVDSNLTVLEYVPISELPIVRVTGLSAMPPMPEPGQRWNEPDLAAAVDILIRLDRMDRLVTIERPLLAEIDRIDVANYNGRQSSHAPHIILYAKDGVEIIWGAEYGNWQRHLESTDKQKIAKLYQHYKEYGTLLTNVKCINLCDPQDDIPLPIDRF